MRDNAEMKAEPLPVVFITGQLGLGGSEQQLYYLLSGLDRCLFEPTVITLGPAPNEPWVAPIEALDIPVIRVPRAFGRGYRLARIAAILRHAKATLVHSWSFHANVYAAVAGRIAGVPVRLGSMRESYTGLSQNALWRWSGLRGLDGLVTNSTTNAEYLRTGGVCPIPVFLVSNGVRVPRELEKVHCEQLKAELGFSSTDRLIGTIARLDTNKNHSMLIKAFHRLSSGWPNARLVIIGKGPMRDQLIKEVSVLGLAGRVLLTGALPDAARYLPAFDVCCLTSRTEGTPNLLMEASAAGVPVVATRSGGSSEVIADGITGFLVPLEDDAIFASRVEFLLAKPEYARRMGACGREKVSGEFSVSAMVTSMSRVYSDQIAAKQRWSAPVGLGAGD